MVMGGAIYDYATITQRLRETDGLIRVTRNTGARRRRTSAFDPSGWILPGPDGPFERCDTDVSWFRNERADWIRQQNLAEW